MFLTLRNEKTLKKMRSKTLKNNIFFILGRNLIIRSFEIPHSIWKLHKDFKSVFVFKFRQKTKKFTPKWQKPLFEKRVISEGAFFHPKLDEGFPLIKTKTCLHSKRIEPCALEGGQVENQEGGDQGSKGHAQPCHRNLEDNQT